MTSTTIYHVPRYVVVYQSNFFKAPSAPPGAPRAHPDWLPFSSSPKLSLPPHGVAWGGAWGPPWASESWESDLYRQFLVDLPRRQRGVVTRSFRLLSARITLRPRDLQPMPIRRISDIGTGAYSIEIRVVMQIRLTVLELVDTYTLRRRRWSDRAAAIGLQADSRHKLLSVYQLLETTRTSMATPSMTIGFSQALSTTPARWSSSKTT